MKRKIIGISIITFGLLLLFGLVYTVFFEGDLVGIFSKLFNGNEVIEEEVGLEKTITETAPPVPPEREIKRITIKEEQFPEESNLKKDEDLTLQAQRDELRRMAASFAERFGSYSNQSNFSNIGDLKIFMSQRMKNWADNYTRQQRAKRIDTSIYYGITTRAIAQEIKEFDDDTGIASVLVMTRRREATSSTSNTSNIFSQDIIINFITENGAWKADSASWQDN